MRVIVESSRMTTRKSKTRQRRRRNRGRVFTTFSDANLVKRAVRERWPTSKENQQLIIDDLAAMFADVDMSDVVAVRRGLVACDTLMLSCLN